MTNEDNGPPANAPPACETVADFYRRSIKEKLRLSGLGGVELERRFGAAMKRVPIEWGGSGERWDPAIHYDPNEAGPRREPPPYVGERIFFDTPFPLPKMRVYGDSPDRIGNLSSFMFNRAWKRIDELPFGGIVHEMARHENGPCYIAGFLTPVTERQKGDAQVGKLTFGLVVRIELAPIANPSGAFRIHDVWAKRNARGAAIVVAMLNWMIGQGIAIVADRDHGFGPVEFRSWFSEFATVSPERPNDAGPAFIARTAAPKSDGAT